MDKIQMAPFVGVALLNIVTPRARKAVAIWQPVHKPKIGLKYKPKPLCQKMRLLTYPKKSRI